MCIPRTWVSAVQLLSTSGCSEQGVPWTTLIRAMIHAQFESFSLGKKWHGKMCCLSLLLKTLWLFLFFHSYLQYPFKQIWSAEFFSTRRCREQSIHILISAVVVYGSFRWYKDKSSFTCHNYVLQKNTTVLLCNFIIFFSLKLLHNKSSNLKWNE